MSFSWPDYLETAKALSTQGDEGSWRSSISRAYYAAFNVAKGYVRQREGSSYQIQNTGNDHAVVWRALMQGNRLEKSAGNHGDRLRKLRTKADYDRVAALAYPGDVDMALAWSAQVIKALRQQDT